MTHPRHGLIGTHSVPRSIGTHPVSSWLCKIKIVTHIWSLSLAADLTKIQNYNLSSYPAHQCRVPSDPIHLGSYSQASLVSHSPPIIAIATQPQGELKHMNKSHC